MLLALSPLVEEYFSELQLSVFFFQDPPVIFKSSLSLTYCIYLTISVLSDVRKLSKTLQSIEVHLSQFAKYVFIDSLTDFARSLLYVNSDPIPVRSLLGYEEDIHP